ncbi:MAG: sensor histidine kinase [Lachnospiraceae bacterium]|nr:sensor histidine kinase [Lachnospiraceae bacterium]
MIYYADYRLIYERSQDLLRNYCEDYGSGGDTADGHTLPPPDKKDGERENASAVRQIYSVFFSGDGSVKAVDLGKVSLYSGKEISDAACRAKNGKENAGRTGKFFYRIERQGDGLLVALINIAFEDEARTLMIRYTVIFGSREQLSGLVAILIENAIAYSAKGECVFVCLKNGQKDICFSVTNTGTEITEEQREHLFDRFYRTDFSRDNENNHYGLGLAIAKKIVELHRARIEVRCEKKCVTFLVTFEKKV